MELKIGTNTSYFPLHTNWGPTTSSEQSLSTERKAKQRLENSGRLLLCCLQNILSSWLQVLCGIMQRVLRTQKKIAVTLVLGKQLFLQKTLSLYLIQFFSLCVFKRSFFIFRHLQELWIPLLRMWNQKPDSVLAVWFYIFCTYQTLFKFVRVAPAQHL